jgi:3-methylcrotonyl-CoA carboxylase alpha subunit
MFNKILIANRGEIACRIIKTAQQLGVDTVAVYSEADINALHVNMADEAIFIGASPARESYLCIDKIIDAAKQSGADAIHPGYGFLSESAEFCHACKNSGIVFIGPPVEAIEAMGSKSAAKTIMAQAGVPLVPGYHGDDQAPATLKRAADEMGYPVLLKATAGGGGKGMRQVWSADEFDDALAAAKRESINAFNDDKMLVEKYLQQPRHVEVQVFCDNHGNAVYLAERDCSLQRRHQKVIEEAPAPFLSDDLRRQMGESAVQSAQAINYQGAGTVEFLLDIDNTFYFMEMNTRLQVEHPVTEMVTGLDLVDWQIRIAGGEPLPLTQQQISVSGHAFEARVYAEDPDHDFLPATGILQHLQAPQESLNVRVDTGVVEGDEIGIYYDPMIAKLIVWDENRDAALRRLKKALREYRIAGLTTNLNFLYNLASVDAFSKGELATNFIEKNSAEIFHQTDQDIRQTQILGALYLTLRQSVKSGATLAADKHSPWHIADNWRLNQSSQYHHEIEINNDLSRLTVTAIDNNRYEIKGEEFAAIVTGKLRGNELLAMVDGHQYTVAVSVIDNHITLYTRAGALKFNQPKPEYLLAESDQPEGALTAPMNGTIVAHVVTAGDSVKEGEPLLVMEAMKMEHTLKAPSNGTVEGYFYQPGELVNGGVELIEFKADETE